ncbi:MAG: thioesterase family protein [Gemmatimonadota bacterium]|jgi:acyl-CoA thioester hydrolase
MSESAESVSEVRVRYAETDQMGVAYHTNYLVWCEIGRTEYMRERGLPYAELERQGVFLAVADAQIRFTAPARYDDRVLVRTRLDRIQTRAVTFAYALYRITAEGTVPIASATTRLVAMDRNGVARKLPDDFLATVRRLHAEAQ